MWKTPRFSLPSVFCWCAVCWVLLLLFVLFDLLVLHFLISFGFSNILASSISEETIIFEKCICYRKIGKVNVIRRYHKIKKRCSTQHWTNFVNRIFCTLKISRLNIKETSTQHKVSQHGDIVPLPYILQKWKIVHIKGNLIYK